jgi:hypothetical protein
VGNVEPVSLILGALLAGATRGTGEVAGTVVKDAYGWLRDALKRRLGGNPAAQTAVEEFAADPDNWRPALEACLKQADVANDEVLLAAAAKVMAAVDAAGAASGKYTVNLAGAQGVQVGDRNSQTNYFGPAAH